MSRLSTAIASLLLCAVADLQAQPIYKYVDANGVTVYTSTRPEGVRAQRVSMNPPPPPTSAGRVPAQGGQNESERAMGGGGGPGNLAIYRYVDARGITVYTNVRPSGGGYTVLRYYCPACDIHSPVDWNSIGLNTELYADEIRAAAERHGVDESLVRAVIHAESAFQRHALSPKGAQGLMQLMPGTADRFGVTDAFDPAQNIDAGVRYLKFLLGLFNEDVRLATAAYNAGEGAVQRFGGIPPYAETRVYVERVGILHQRYGGG